MTDTEILPSVESCCAAVIDGSVTWKRLIAVFVFVAVWSFRLTNYADRHVPYMWQCYNCSRLPDNDVMSHSTHCSSSACCRLNVNGGNKLPSNADSGVSSKLDLNNSLFQRAGRHRPQALFRTLRVSIQELTVVFRPSRNCSSSACCRLNVKGGSNLLSNADSGGSSKLDLQLMIVFVCQILSRQAMQFCDKGIAFHKGVVLGLTASLRHNREWQCHMDVLFFRTPFYIRDVQRVALPTDVQFELLGPAGGNG